MIDPRLMSDTELQQEVAAIESVTGPMYKELRELGDSVFRHRSWRYTPEAQAINDRIKPWNDRLTSLGYEQARRLKEIANNLAWEKKAKRVAEAPVYQRRNGWEIVKDTRGTFLQYAVRHPVTKEEVYMGRLSRCRQVADESKP